MGIQSILLVGSFGFIQRSPRIKTKNEENGFQRFTHKDLYLTTYLITNALPNVFAYLQDNEIPYMTNCLEIYFTHLKEKLPYIEN